MLTFSDRKFLAFSLSKTKTLEIKVWQDPLPKINSKYGSNVFIVWFFRDTIILSTYCLDVRKHPNVDDGIAEARKKH